MSVGHNVKESSYRTRINKVLAGKTFTFDPQTVVKLRQTHDGIGTLDQTISADQVWDLKRNDAGHIFVRIGHKKCDLCGHNPIKNIFTIVNKQTSEEMEIGCDCAKNYADADLIAGIVKEFRWEYNKIVNPIRFENELPALEWGAEVRRSLTYTLRAARAYNMIHSGNPMDILRKIRAGKNIGKKEREVISLWVELYADRDNVVANEAAKKAAAEAERERVRAEREKARQEREAAYARKNLKTNIVRLMANIDKYAALRDAYAVIDAAKERATNATERDMVDTLRREYSRVTIHNLPINSGVSEIAKLVSEIAKRDIVKEQDENQRIFAALYSADLSENDAKFVNSVYSFFKRTGKVSPKQMAVLTKIENNSRKEN